jgi:hypothetical protein
MLLFYRNQVDPVHLSLAIYLQDQKNIKGFQEMPNPHFSCKPSIGVISSSLLISSKYSKL